MSTGHSPTHADQPPIPQALNCAVGETPDISSTYARHAGAKVSALNTAATLSDFGLRESRSKCTDRPIRVRTTTEYPRMPASHTNDDNSAFNSNIHHPA